MLYCKLESLEEIKTAGKTIYQFCQAIIDSRDNAIEYIVFLKEKFRGAIDSIEGKRLETIKITKETESTKDNISTAKLGKRLDAWVGKLHILKDKCKKNKTTLEEAHFYREFVYQILSAEKTVEHCSEMLKEHNGDAARELVKVLKENNVDINTYIPWRQHCRQSLHENERKR